MYGLLILLAVVEKRYHIEFEYSLKEKHKYIQVNISIMCDNTLYDSYEQHPLIIFLLD